MGFEEVKKEFFYQGISFDVYLDKRDIVIQTQLEKTKTWEEEQLSLYEGLLPEGGIFVDIGANVGINSIFLSKKIKNSQVYAVEPQNENYFFLKKNIHESRASVQVIQKAISSSSEPIRIRKFGANAKIALQKEKDGTLVPATTLDLLLKDLSLAEVDLIKIDVEGFTDLALAQSAEACRISKHFIVEFSLGDMAHRLETQDKGILLSHIEDLLLKFKGRSWYFISRYKGLVEFSSAQSLYTLLLLSGNKAGVADVLLTQVKQKDSISSVQFITDEICQILEKNNEMRLKLQKVNSAH